MEDEPRPEPYRTIKEASEHYKVVTRTLYRWIGEGMPALDVGKGSRPDYRVRLSEVEDWLRARKPALGQNAPAGSDDA